MYARLPDELLSFTLSKSMQRLKDVDMNCGLIYTSLPLFCGLQPYSRYDHSLGTAELAWHFTQDPVIALSALFHDISTPCFSHVVDFMHGDHENQEFTEANTGTVIASDRKIVSLLQQLGISRESVSDYHQYPVADNDSPKLSCDRLEYTLQNMVRYGLENKEFAAEALSDLSVGQNELAQTELVFNHEETARRFALAAVGCGRIYSGKEDRYAMEILARLLKAAIQDGTLTEEDLYGTEKEMIRKLKQSPHGNAWQSFTRLHEVHVVKDGCEGAFAVAAKKRYIDPYIHGKGRVSEVFPLFAREIERFLKEDYSVLLKGEF